MSEHDSHPGPEEARTPTDEQLRQGFYLEDDETVKFDVPTSAGRVRRSYGIGNGVEIHNGQPVAEMRLGGDKTFATAYVINTFNAPDRRHDTLVVHSPSSNRTFTAELTQGEMWGIGRSYEGQDMLPDTVSGDHCAVGMDENNRLVIENHSPTNRTAVRRIG